MCTVCVSLVCSEFEKRLDLLMVWGRKQERWFYWRNRGAWEWRCVERDDKRRCCQGCVFSFFVFMLVYMCVLKSLFVSVLLVPFLTFITHPKKRSYLGGWWRGGCSVWTMLGKTIWLVPKVQMKRPFLNNKHGHTHSHTRTTMKWLNKETCEGEEKKKEHALDLACTLPLLLPPIVPQRTNKIILEVHSNDSFFFIFLKPSPNCGYSWKPWKELWQQEFHASSILCAIAKKCGSLMACPLPPFFPLWSMNRNCHCHIDQGVSNPVPSSLFFGVKNKWRCINGLIPATSTFHYFRYPKIPALERNISQFQGPVVPSSVTISLSLAFLLSRPNENHGIVPHVSSIYPVSCEEVAVGAWTCFKQRRWESAVSMEIDQQKGVWAKETCSRSLPASKGRWADNNCSPLEEVLFRLQIQFNGENVVKCSGWSGEYRGNMTVCWISLLSTLFHSGHQKLKKKLKNQATHFCVKCNIEPRSNAGNTNDTHGDVKH